MELFKGSKSLAEELRKIEESVSLDIPEGRRIAIRSAFAAMEALVSELSSYLVERLPPSDHFSHEEKHRWFLEICALSNISYRINDKGDLRLDQPNIPMRDRTLFVLNMCARTTKTQLAPRNVEGWNDFKEAIKIRNRITHAKNQQDLKVSSKDYNIVINAVRWFVRCKHRALGGTSY